MQERVTMNTVPNSITVPDSITEALAFGSKIESPEPITINSSNMSCIDGRQQKEGVFAGPGGALGFMIVILDAAHKMNLAETKDDYITLMTNIVAEIGPITWHSDDHEHAEDALACAGCGHCNGILTNPELYNIDTTLVQAVIQFLSTQPKENADILQGSHGEAAVIILPENPPHMTLPGTTDHGQAFIYHKDVWEDNLQRVARNIFIDEDMSTKDALQKQILESTNRQLAVTVIKLGADRLPQFIISANGDIV